MKREQEKKTPLLYTNPKQETDKHYNTIYLVNRIYFLKSISISYLKDKIKRAS